MLRKKHFYLRFFQILLAIIAFLFYLCIVIVKQHRKGSG